MRDEAASARVEVIQALLDSRQARNYLEIGVQSGDTFFRIKAKKKIAVDPRFLFRTINKLRWIRWNRSNIRNEYYQITSDEFFSRYPNVLTTRPPDVVFVDGLHTYEQSLRDIENSLRYLRSGGVIVVDDCIPPEESASKPSKPNNNAPWCGDVWKSILHLRATRRDLRVFVLDCAYGLGVVAKQPAMSNIAYTPAEISDMSYDLFYRDRARLLDLVPKDYLSSYILESSQADTRKVGVP